MDTTLPVRVTGGYSDTTIAFVIMFVALFLIVFLAGRTPNWITADVREPLG